MAQHRQQPQGGLLGRIRLRSPVRVLLVVAVVSVIVATQGQFLGPVCRAVTLSCQLLCLRAEYQHLSADTEQLAEVIAYIGTEDGQELAARSELDALKRGERLIICDPSQPASSRRLGVSQLLYRSLSRRYQAWRNTATHLADLVSCLFGTSDASVPDAAGDSARNYELENLQP